jgi:hypothetical protein
MPQGLRCRASSERTCNSDFRQAEAEARTDYIKVTPGACQTGRMFGCDDVDRLALGVMEAFQVLGEELA